MVEGMQAGVSHSRQAFPGSRNHVDLAVRKDPLPVLWHGGKTFSLSHTKVTFSPGLLW